jgi:hypothetical protein
MQARFLIDPDTQLPHIYNHGVEEQEAIDVVERPGLLLHGSGGALMALGQTRAGRYLKVVHRRDTPGELFIITAFSLTGNALKSYRRRRRHGRS